MVSFRSDWSKLETDVLVGVSCSFATSGNIDEFYHYIFYRQLLHLLSFMIYPFPVCLKQVDALYAFKRIILKKVIHLSSFNPFFYHNELRNFEIVSSRKKIGVK